MVQKQFLSWLKGGLMSQILKKDMIDVTNLLEWFCKNGKTDFRPDAANAFRFLASNGLIDSFYKEDMLRITDALAKCVEGFKNSKKYVSRAILEFSKRNLLFSYSKEEIFKISSKLLKYAVCDEACGKSVQETVGFLNEIVNLKI